MTNKPILANGGDDEGGLDPVPSNEMNDSGYNTAAKAREEATEVKNNSVSPERKEIELEMEALNIKNKKEISKNSKMTPELIEELDKLVKEKVKSFDPKQKADVKFKKKEGMKEITWCEMVTRYASTCDKIVLFWAYFGSISVAVVRPGFSLAFGLVVDGVGDTASAGKDVSEVGFEKLGGASWFMVAIGVITGLF